jgi:hypothetical protein
MVVPLDAYYARDKKLLVYEFMPNDSLFFLLPRKCPQILHLFFMRFPKTGPSSTIISEERVKIQVLSLTENKVVVAINFVEHLLSLLLS